MTHDATQTLAAEGAAAPLLPVVAIVGRPNVGKSTLFNRLVRQQRAIVDQRPGVTRDRNIASAQWGERAFRLVDTGGFEDADVSVLAASVRAQSRQAAEQADVVIAVLDGRAGLQPPDRDIVERLRRLRKPVVYAVNKLDTPAHENEAADFFALGLEEVFAISAAHGSGVAALMERVVQLLPASAAVARAAGQPVALAIVGRPNVGKSSLLNRIVGYERAIVDATPGTTRDPVDTPFRHGQQEYVLIDTAGMRRRPRIHEQLEQVSVARALRTLARAEVAVLVVDAVEGMTDQDARIAGHAWTEGRGLLLVVNKWDAVPRAERDRSRLIEELRGRYATLADVPIVVLSARTGAHVADLFPALEQVVAAHRRQMRTVQLNQALADAVRAQAPPSVKGKRPRFYYATQTATAPPTITIFANAPQLVQTAYERYLTHTLRAAFALEGTPLRLRFRGRSRPARNRPKR